MSWPTSSEEGASSRSAWLGEIGSVDPVALGLPDYFDVIKEPMVRRNAGRLGLLVHHRPQGPALRGNRPSAF